MKRKNFKMVTVVGMVLVMVVTLGAPIMLQNNAKASEVVVQDSTKGSGILDWFKQPSIKNAIITLENDEFDWTGEFIKPEVTVEYEGNTLVLNEDYTLEYKNNKHAGTASVIIAGIGDYKGKKTCTFEIIGIDMNTQCTFKYNAMNDTYDVYFNDQKLNGNEYRITKTETKTEISRVPCNNFDVVTYAISKTYTITGKNQYTGKVVKQRKSTHIENDYN